MKMTLDVAVDLEVVQTTVGPDKFKERVKEVIDRVGDKYMGMDTHVFFDADVQKIVYCAVVLFQADTGGVGV